MIVSCENCGARYKLDPARITGRGVRITCPRCKNVFVVYRQQAEATGELPMPSGPADDGTPDDDEATQIFTRKAAAPRDPAPTKAAPPSKPAAAPAKPTPAPADPAPAAKAAPKGERGDVAELDFAAVGISGWKVKVRIGLVYDFSDYKTLARYIKDGRVDEDDQISHDGQTWTRLGDIDDLEEHFFEVYEAAALSQQRSSEAFGEDQPTRIVGAAALAGKMDSTLDDEPDEDLAATMAAAAAAEDGDYEIGSTGAQKATGPTFNDPFARQRNAGGQRRRKKSAPAAKKDAPEKSSKAPLLLGLVALLAVGGGGAWYVQSMNDQPTSQDLAAEAKREHEIAKKAVQKEAKAYEQQLSEDLRRTLEKQVEGEEDQGWVSEDPDDKLIPVGGPGSGSARAPSPPPPQPSGMAVSNDPSGMASGTMSAAPTSPQDHYNSGRALFREGRWNEAASAFRQAVAGNPNSGEYRTWLGYSLMKAGQLDDARTELVAATNKGSAMAHYHLGDLAAMQGDVGGAVGHWQAYLKEVPGDEARVQAKIDALMR